MTRPARSRPPVRHSAVLPVVLALALALQALASGVGMGEAGRGLIEMCIGGQIVQVAADAPLHDPAGAAQDHCSLCGITLAPILSAGLPGAAPTRAVAQRCAIPAARLRPRTRITDNPARAPPATV